jgi:hypothetical protein
VKAYAAWCAAVLLGFAALEWRGVGLIPDTQHVNIPASVRGSPGGYRVYRSWGGGGFRGGK